MKISEETIKAIHFAIHGFDEYAFINGKRYDINIYKNGCRYMDYDNIRFMEQNMSKSSIYAKKARSGALITWGMRGDAPWIYVESEAKDFREFPFNGPTFSTTSVQYGPNPSL